MNFERPKVTATSNSNSIGLVTILTAIFAAGKVFGFINWSWWWVFSPVWISLGVVVGIILILFMGALIWEFIK